MESKIKRQNSTQLISIVGPTATGKTKLALQLTKVLASNHSGFDLITADSRQVFRGLEIISGADLPLGFESKKTKELSLPFFVHHNVNIHGISIISPQAEWSVAHFQQFALEVINWSVANNRLPIVVGGTGLYHHHLFNQDPKLYIKPDLKLRQKLSKLTVADLQYQLNQSDPTKLTQMNNSDKNNPARLIRAIEISQAKTPEIIIQKILPNLKQVTVGLTDNLAHLESKIKIRVQERITQGAIKEVVNLFAQKDVNRQIISATGVREIKEFLNGEIDREELIKSWSLREFQYAKRQLTWWKKEKDIYWFKTEKVDIKKIVKLF